MSKNKEEFVDVEPQAEVVEECQDLEVMSDMGTFVDSPSTVHKLMRPAFISVSKDTATATIGKENFKLLSVGEPTDVVIIKIDQLEYLKANPDDLMGRPIKYTSPEEAIAAGERINFGNNSEKPTVAPSRDVSMLVRNPGDPAPAFGIDLAEAEWAVGKYSCSRTAYYQNMQDDEGILKTIRFYVKNGTPLYQLLWNVQPVLHKYKSGFTAGYLKFTLRKKLADDDKIFTEIRDALIGGQ